MNEDHSTSLPAPETTQPRRAHIFCIGNQKGGVGKTTIATHLARALVELGKKVLVIDLDKSGNTTKYFGIDPTACFGSYEVIMKAERAVDVILTNDEDDIELPDNLHVLAGGTNLTTVEDKIRTQTRFPNPAHLLKPHLEELRQDYDYIFLDTPPANNIVVAAAYMAADYSLLATIPERGAIDGLADSVVDLEDAQDMGSSVQLFGVAVGAVDMRTRLARTLIRFVEESFTDPDGQCWMLEPVIPRSTNVPTAQGQGRTVFDAQPGGKIALAYLELAKAVEDRLESLQDEEKTLTPFVPPKEQRQEAQANAWKDLSSELVVHHE